MSDIQSFILFIYNTFFTSEVYWAEVLVTAVYGVLNYWFGVWVGSGQAKAESVGSK